MVDINEKLVIYYAVRGYRSGQTVTLTVYDTAGNVEINAQTMTEQGTTGIYQYNFYPAKRTQYLAKMDCTEFPQPSHQVITVKKQKLSGAINIPKINIPAPSWEKEEKIKLFKELSTLQKFITTQDIPEKFIEISNKTREYIVRELSKTRTFSDKEALEKISEKIEAERVRTSLSLKKDKEKTTNELSEVKSIIKEFAGSIPSFNKSLLEEVSELRETVKNKLPDLKQVISELIKQSDEISQIMKLTNSSFNSKEFKEKIELLNKNTDELNLLLKNDRTKK